MTFLYKFKFGENTTKVTANVNLIFKQDYINVRTDQ